MTTWQRIAKRYYDMAVWFSTHEPGTPVPDWCFLSWPPTEVKRLISSLEHKNSLARKQLSDGVCFDNKLQRAIRKREHKISQLKADCDE